LDWRSKAASGRNRAQSCQPKSLKKASNREPH
jgi:hypothetical protein